MDVRPEPEYATYKSYAMGFFLCVVLTLAAYFAVQEQVFADRTLVAVICTLGLIQVVVQLILFLHIDKEKSPRWNLYLFLTMLFLLLVVVIGSLWIMANIRYNVMRM